MQSFAKIPIDSWGNEEKTFKCIPSGGGKGVGRSNEAGKGRHLKFDFIPTRQQDVGAKVTDAGHTIPST